MASSTGIRTPWQVTRSVWFALFMREAVSRTMADRFGWFWMLFEPIAFTLIMVAIRTFIRGDRFIVGADFVPWLIVGLLGFFLVRSGMMEAMGAIQANKALLAYRQVTPVDPVLVRNAVDTLLRTVVLGVFVAGGLLIDIDLFPDQFYLAAFGWLGLWLLGLGAGLITSVAGTLIPEVARIIRMLNLPLLIISGVIFPLQVMPRSLLEWLLYNPIPHGLEYLRLGFFESYQMVDGISLLYFWLFVLGFLALGLVLHIRYAAELQAR